MNKSVLLNLLLLTALASNAHAGSAKDQLDAFYREVKSMQADFTQTVIGESITRKDESKGVLRLQRPGRFRWDYTEPYEQKIVADGERLWIYDMDLDQVIVKPLDFVLGNTPAVLLSGNVSLTDKFDITEYEPDTKTNTNTNDELAWVKLAPKQDDTGFQQLFLGFRDNNLMQMDLIDSFGQMTHLEFSNLKRNPGFDPVIFRFEPPPGVDVISDTQE